MTVYALLVDDEARSRKFAQRLSREGLECTPVEPTGVVEALLGRIRRRVEDGSCDVLILDYKLDDEAITVDGDRASYRGAQVAAGIREYQPDLPIALITTDDRLQQYLKAAPSLSSLFDHVILKGRMTRDERSDVIREVIDLAEGYRAISGSALDSWSDLSDLLHTDFANLSGVTEGTQPLAGHVARWLLEELLRFPGPLVDRDDGAALVGLDPISFEGEHVQAALEGCKYRGPFNEWHNRWWRRCLEQWLASLVPNMDDSTRYDRYRNIEGRLELSTEVLSPAACNWCGSAEVVRACINCREAIDPSHGLPTLAPRPPWVDNCMICYRCIQTGKDRGYDLGPGTGIIVSGLRSGRITPSESDG